MKCSVCKKDFTDDARFCPYCGEAVKADLLGASAGRSDAPASAEVTSKPAGDPSPVEPSPAKAAALDPANEKPVWHGRASWKASGWIWILWLLATVLLIYLCWDKGWHWYILTAGGAVGLILLLQQAIKIYGMRYTLTTQRLFFEKGILSRTKDQTELVRVDDLRVIRNLWDRLCGTGSIEIMSTDRTSQNPGLRGILDPDEVSEMIRLNTRTARSRQTLFVENV